MCGRKRRYASQGEALNAAMLAGVERRPRTGGAEDFADLRLFRARRLVNSLPSLLQTPSGPTDFPT